MPGSTPRAVPRTARRRAPITVDLVALTPLGRRLALLVRPATTQARERWEIPWQPLGAGESLADCAARLTRTAVGAAGSCDQIAAFGDRRRHPSGGLVSVAFLALAPAGAATPSDGASWFPVDGVPAIPPRQRVMVDGALQAVRARLDQSPIAFRLLPPTFTLSQLQEVYELLLGRRLHKASFRRALHAAWLVEPTDEWRREGRGRPAQLFRYQPRRRRNARRGVRLDALGS